MKFEMPSGKPESGGLEGEERHERTKRVLGKIKNLSRTQIRKRISPHFLTDLDILDSTHEKGIFDDDTYWEWVIDLLHNYGIEGEEIPDYRKPKT